MNDLLILGTLLGGPQHGYALKKKAGLIFGEGALHNNLVYPLLRRFESRGWITRRKTPGKRGQTRLEYSLSPGGREELIRRVAEFNEKQALSAEEFRLRVGFFGLLRTDARQRMLEAREKALRAQAEKFRHLEEELDLGTYGGEVVSFLRRQIHAELAWIGRLHKIAAPKKGRRQ
jgi:DNA-binding PadR family transcriptional regulator